MFVTQNTKMSPGFFGMTPLPQTSPKPPAPNIPQTIPTAPNIPQTQPGAPPQADNPYQRMAKGIMAQRFNRKIPAGASRGGAIATGIGGILDNAVDGWNARRTGGQEAW